ncbi:hypothetical protein MSAN_02423600 [Mycena sanguinolenta]|uniref:Uncharacterized protein n=1 Tax=Mycena sanguinolenta TaxID=230812 RepID=A0A8H6X3C4_9AGAR|nr:hypothetical protein MSAN_02423600 [Mycena sanguinolenta]
MMLDPFLPHELEHAIFELAALTHPKRIPILMLVAHRVKNWVEHLLYRVVIMMSTLPRRDLFNYPMLIPETLLNIIRVKPPEFLPNSVQHLFLNATIKRNELTAIYSACIHVTNLVDYLCGSPQNPAFGRLSHLRRLTLGLQDFLICYNMNHTHPTLRRITHLQLLSTWNHGSLAELTRCLPLVPSLTHIALRSVSHDVPLQNTLCAAQNICCIVFLEVPVGDRIGLVTNELALDPRFVCLDWGGGFVEDWLHSVDTGEDYWAFAEAFIAARQAGRVDRSRYTVSSTDTSWMN